MKRIHNYSCSGLTLQSESFFPVFSSLYIRIDICHSVCINKFIILFIQLVSQRKPVVSSFTIFSVFTCPLWYSKNRAAVRIISYDTPVHIYKNWGINIMDKNRTQQCTGRSITHNLCQCPCQNPQWCHDDHRTWLSGHRNHCICDHFTCSRII